MCCDLLSNFVSLIFCYICLRKRLKYFCVVICFQILYLWYSVTSNDITNKSKIKLWFAFKFCIFDILLHRGRPCKHKLWSCDLLSNFVSLIFCYIWFAFGVSISSVVICFQILYLWYSVTSAPVRNYLVLSCDLLSNFVSLIFCYILELLLNWYNSVVICFQILYLWYSVTSTILQTPPENQLWFAFKFCIFDILLHRPMRRHQRRTGCDLLSNFVSLIFCYIYTSLQIKILRVVICFQILYLWYSVTSYHCLPEPIRLLWFAFKFCIFDILLHPYWVAESSGVVVICFQILYLWYSVTS